MSKSGEHWGEKQELEETKEFEIKEAKYLHDMETRKEFEEQPHEEDIHKDSQTEMLEHRRSTHGDFKIGSRIVQDIKQTMRATPNWHYMEPYQKEALDMVAHKIARIVTGDPKFIDAWRDIIGYTQRVVENLEQDQDATDVRNVKMIKLKDKWVDSL